MLWPLSVVLVANTNGRLAIPALAGRNNSNQLMPDLRRRPAFGTVSPSSLHAGGHCCLVLSARREYRALLRRKRK